MENFWAVNLFELQKYRNLKDKSDLFDNVQSFTNYIKEIFPINGIPDEIANELLYIDQKITILHMQYEAVVKFVCDEIQKISEQEGADL